MDTFPNPPPVILELRSTKRRMSIAEMPPAAGASVVFTATSAAEPALAKPYMYKVDPQLKPYQPNQRIKVPRAAFGTFSDGCSFCAAGAEIQRRK